MAASERLRSGLGLLASFALFACAEDPKRPPYEGDRSASIGGSAGGGGGAPTDGGRSGEAGLADDGGSCTDLVNEGVATDVNDVVGDFVGAGGIITDGTYTIVEARRFLGAGGVPTVTNTSLQGTIRITGSTFERVLVTTVAGVAGQETRARGTFTTNGTNAATINITCPTASDEPQTYSATTNGVTLSNTATKVTLTFTKRL
jgi:hypothetical protein